MSKRNKDSDNQKFMHAFFGENASNYKADHNTWPEPYKSIYNRMLRCKWKIGSWHEIETGKAALQLMTSLENFLATVDKERN